MGGMYSGKDSKNPIGHVIIDEGSMLSTGLFFEFVSIYRDAMTSLLVVGDTCQLQPIEWGGCMSQLMESNTIKTCRFVKNYRAVNDVYCVDENGAIAPTDHCVHISGGVDTVMIEYKKRLSLLRDFHDIIILTPTNEAVDTINSLCQEYRLEKNEALEYICDGSGRRFLKGDKIILKKNLKDRSQANGDIGTIININKTSRKLEVRFDRTTKYVSVGRDEFDKDYSHYSRFGSEITTNDIRLAYCLTIHSCQGSEWKEVLLYVSDANLSVDFFNFYMLNTAIPRAREYIAIIGDIDKIQRHFRLKPKARKESLASRIVALLKSDTDDETT
jgi:exodeoxyribonuclease V alpha subunit